MTISDVIVPSDSLLQKWLYVQGVTEVPVGYQLACGLSVFGALLGRSVYTDQVNFNVWPNMSVLLVGPSGIGKDTIIDQATDVIQTINNSMIVGGRTMEYIYERMWSLNQVITPTGPSVAYISIPELSAFFGGKDYKKSMVQEFTDLLTTKKQIDISTKGSPGRYLFGPTPTIHAGTTADWLHVAMPEGALEGGFVPRFFVVSEDYAAKSVPLIKFAVDPAERKLIDAARREFYAGAEAIFHEYRHKYTELSMLYDARMMYAAWYPTRLTRYGKNMQAYAVRSRDHVLRLAMLCAITRFRTFMDEQDVGFGIAFMDYVMERIQSAVQPMTREYRCGEAILEMLPAQHKAIMGALLPSFDRRVIQTAEQALLESGRMDRAVTGEFIEVNE